VFVFVCLLFVCFLHFFALFFVLYAFQVLFVCVF
jgi:hypothetical protein